MTGRSGMVSSSPPQAVMLLWVLLPFLSCCSGFNSNTYDILSSISTSSSTAFFKSLIRTTNISSSRNRNKRNRCPLSTIPTTTTMSVHHTRDADMYEVYAGGERYEMVPLPDSMVDQTVFVGNLCEFVQDDDLSQMFQRVSHLQSVPACVARRANRDSLQYGFVTFPTVEEKEAAIVRFHGVEFMGRKLRVEEIRDDPRKGRVKVPEKIVSYVLGAAKSISRKKKKNGTRLEGGLRRIAPRLSKDNNSNNGSSSNNNTPTGGSSTTTSSSVKQKKQQRKATTIPSSSSSSSKAAVSYIRLVAKLNDNEKDEFVRATKRGFVSVNIGTGCNRSKLISKSRLVSAHRQWCDERRQPQIIHCKSFSRAGPRQGIDSDCIIVDLSPLRIFSSAIMGASYDANDFLVRWKAQVVTAATTAGMEPKALLDDNNDNEMDDTYWMDYSDDDEEDDDDYNDDDDDDQIVSGYEEVDDECPMYFDNSDECDNEEEDYDLLGEVENDFTDDNDDMERVIEPPTTMNEESTWFIVEMSEKDSWANQPISCFPVVSIGEFEGQRTNAKAMARELAGLWQLLPEEELEQDDDDDDSLLFESSRSVSAYSRGGGAEVKHSANFASTGPGGRAGGGGSKPKKDRKTEIRRRRRNNNCRDMDFFN